MPNSVCSTRAGVVTRYWASGLVSEVSFRSVFVPACKARTGIISKNPSIFKNMPICLIILMFPTPLDFVIIKLTFTYFLKHKKKILVRIGYKSIYKNNFNTILAGF